ncbi:MAG: hypothetical protein U5L72_10015 [Bacteroidales bacterium]|nr:hypothetical protein [Bacteroidales bacterium]
MIRKIARTIHSRYLHDLKKQGQVPAHGQGNNIKEFDDLAIEIQHSNIDNAAHIPTKLLSIGYRIRPVNKGFKPLTLHLDAEEIEAMARVETPQMELGKKTERVDIRKGKRRKKQGRSTLT